MPNAAKKQALAEAIGAFAARHDRLFRNMGMQLVDIGPGRCTIRMTVTDAMLNSFDMGHGGAMFGLADVAFAVTCNSHDSRHVAQTCTISFLRPSASGDVLTARAVESLREDKVGICDITITNQHDQTVAVFRGQSRGIGGHVLPESSSSQETSR